jgi:Flp pilus assembly protein TadG
MYRFRDLFTPRLPAAARRRLRHFRRSEDGSAIIFTLFLLSVLLIVAGYAVDTMRFENKRARLQATLDRAVLAAADLDQTLPCEDVVRDYFDKSDLLDEITSITCTESLNGRTVEATAALEMNTLFMQGTDQLVAPASGAATEFISDVEIVLVLDVSGSMRSNSRLVNLRAAAQEFVNEVLENDEEDRISVAIVPFNAQVNLGPTLFNAYANVFDEHGLSNLHCVDLPTSAWNDPSISPSTSMPQAAHFDANSSTTRNTSYYAPQAPVFSTTSSINDAVPTCKPWTENFVRLPSQNITQMQTQLNLLRGDGNTSIYLGMKWGLALLDPASRPIITSAISAGQVPATLSGRPFDYDREDTMKVLVLMTDGEHVSSTVMNDGYRSGLSPIYRGADGRYAIHHPTSTRVSGRKYYTPHNNAWNTTASWSGSGTVTQLTWPEVWTSVRMQWVAWQLYARPWGTSTTTRDTYYTNQMNAFRRSTNVTTMNTQLQESCAQARDNGIIVFGIAFEAPVNGQTQISQCASSPSHYYNAAGLQISAAFNSIANQINALRLVQ